MEQPIVQLALVNTRSTIRIVFAVAVLSCLVAMVLMPGATTAVVVPSHTHGKQTVRIISVLSILALAAAAYQGMVRNPASPIGSFRQVCRYAFGTDLLDQICTRLC